MISKPVRLTVAVPRAAVLAVVVLGCLILCATATPATAAEPRQLVPVDGAPQSATLTAADADWRLTFDSEDAQRTFSAAELISWGAPVEANTGPQLVLSTGDIVVGQLIGADQQWAVVDSPEFGEIRLPLESVSVALLEPPVGAVHRERFIERLLSSDTNSDRLILVNGDELEGTVLAIRKEEIEFDTDLGLVKIGREKIVAVALDQALVARPEAVGLHGWVGTSDGSRILARSLIVEGETARIRTLDNVSLETATTSLRWLQPLGGRAVYLSDLEPDGYRHVPYLNLDWPCRRDRSVTGSRLKSGGRMYAKGLGMHSASRITYRLDKPYLRFQALLAIDEAAGRRGSVTFRVYVDGDQKYASGVIRGGDEPQPVSVPLSGAKRISLVVDFADRGDELDHANWLDARLVR